MLTIRAFRAIDDEVTCREFMDGHMKALADYGITNIATNNALWKENPAVYVIVAENETKEVVGGVRLHATSTMEPLPLEDAIGDLDSRVGEEIYKYAIGTTGELCGLWGSRQIAGSGISDLLVRSLVAITEQLSLVSLFTFCSEYTTDLGKRVGFCLNESVGDGGSFIYPGINYVGKFFCIDDITNLQSANACDRVRIMDLRRKPFQTTDETTKKGIISVVYDLFIRTHNQNKTPVPVEAAR